MQSGLCDCRHEEITPRHHPKHLALGPRDNTRREKCRRRPIHCAVSAARHLMQAAKRQPTSRKPAVDFRYAEGQHLARTTRRAFEAGDALSKFRNDRTGDGFGHIEKGCSLWLCKGSLRWYVLYLFSFAV